MKFINKRGRTFHFTLPCNVVIEQEAVRINSEIAPLPVYGNKTILLVEDDDLSFEFMFKILSKMQVMVLWAKDGNDAIENCDAHHAIDLILMDIRLPGMGGFLATKTVKEKYPQIPIIAQTAFGNDQEKEEALVSGFDDYITKPVDQNKLVEILNHFFQ